MLDVMRDHPNSMCRTVDNIVESDCAMSTELKGLCGNLGHMLMQICMEN